MKYFVIFFVFLPLFFSCNNTADPIAYDKNIKALEKQVGFIHLLINNANFDKASELLKEELVLYPNNIDLLTLKAWLLLQQGKYDQSKKAFQKLLDRNKKNPLALIGLARIARILGDKNLSIKYIEESLGYKKSISAAWLEKGLLQYENKDYKEALVSFNKASLLDKNDYDAVFFKYVTFLRLGRELDDVKQYWQSIIKAHKTKSWYFLYLADTLLIHDKKLAYQIVENGILHFPDEPYLLNMLAYLQFQKYQVQKNQEFIENAKENIIKCMENSQRLRPEFIDTYFSILKIMKEEDKIKEELEKYIIIFPDSPLLLKWQREYYK